MPTKRHWSFIKSLIIRLPFYIIVIPVITIFYLISFLPWSVQRVLIKPIAYLARFSNRWQIVVTNLGLCFPKKSNKEIKQLAYHHFHEILCMLMLLLNAWHKTEKITKYIKKIEGIEHILEANKNNQGCIVLGAHFTTMDVANMGLSKMIDLAAVYKQSEDPLINYIMLETRKRLNRKLINKYETRELIKHLRNGGNLWYAFDQEFGGKKSIKVPFFGFKVNSLSSLDQIIKLGKAKLCPISYYLSDDGYIITIHPPFELEDNTSATELSVIYMKFIETIATKYPEQYYWIHRRFKSSMRY